ncbi:metallophosphoesterase-like protein [Xylariaceae sp. FL1272]|nr:metallophosphoesterase-like protein [Xylariaceae sp. FL1272]
MKLYAIGDLHLGYEFNKTALNDLEPHLEDGLILAGDVGEKPEHLEHVFAICKNQFKEVFWVPGNHELYTMPPAKQPRGVAKYGQCVEIARKYGIHTPEDDFFRWEGEGGPVIIAPIFTLYDYTFRPADITHERAVKWAEEADTVATDEFILHTDPYISKDDWCKVLVDKFETKLRETVSQNPGTPLIIINHWPLREDLVFIPRVPRFSLWCGTKATEDWHTRFNAKVVVSGHLHVRRTDWKDHVRFEECSLGYPKQWEDAREKGRNINDMLREILPGPEPPESGVAETKWRRFG